MDGVCENGVFMFEKNIYMSMQKILCKQLAASILHITVAEVTSSKDSLKLYS